MRRREAASLRPRLGCSYNHTSRSRIRDNYGIDYAPRPCYIPKIPLIEGRFLEAFPEGGAGCGVPAAARKPCPGGSDRNPSRRQLRRRCAERAQNRHGGAPRGAVPVARDGPRYANVASRDYARDRIKDTASRRSAIPSVGDEEAEKEGRTRGTRKSRERRNGRCEFRRMG
jgi:hypothetical protein